jgi:AcrR family transcriptional regulator
MLLTVSHVNPSRRRTPRSEVRERILTAAMTTFASEGFVGATIDMIADASGFTKGAVYSNFGSKDDLFFALLDAQVTARVALITKLTEQVGASEGPESAAAAIGKALTQFIRENTDYELLLIEYLLRAARDPQIRARFVKHRRMLIDQTMKAIIDPVALAGTGLPPEALTTLLIALTNGLAIEEIIAPGTVPPDLLGAVLESATNPPPPKCDQQCADE